MDKLLKPERLSVDLNSSETTKQWKHWVRSFENYLESIEQVRQENDPPISTLRILTNSFVFKTFDFIESCDTYETAFGVLRNLFVKTTNAIFAWHILVKLSNNQGKLLTSSCSFWTLLSKRLWVSNGIGWEIPQRISLRCVYQCLNI